MDFGMVPRICFGIFDMLAAKAAAGPGGLETVDYSHIEIYNEHVRDLLSSPHAGYLKVREHPKKGVFVENLTTVRVTSFEDVMSLIEIGEKNRTVAATNVNLHSSRSHAIVTLTLVQRAKQAPKHGLPTSGLQEKVARLHMVDLAGSERAATSGATGTRLREANNINKSLSTLGDVIKSLGEPKSRRGHIPYRNSTLTTILRDSLGGNSHVLFIAAVSPCTADYDETISTLKFAERARKVKLRVEANVTEGIQSGNFTADMVPLLQAEVSKLREMLKAQQEQQELQNLRFQQQQQQEQLRVEQQHHQQLTKQSLMASMDSVAIGGGGGSGNWSPHRRTVRFADEAEAQAEEAAEMAANELAATAAREDAGLVEEMKQRVQELEQELAKRELLITDLERARQEQELEITANASVLDTTVTSPSPSVMGGADVSDMGGGGGATPKGALELQGPTRALSPQRLVTDRLRTDRTPDRHSGRANATGQPSPPRNQPVVLLNEDVVDTSQPRVINLNQDPLFSECLVYYIPDGNVTAGSDENQSDILLSGPDILSKHCTFTNKNGLVYLEPIEKAQIFVNGDLIQKESSRSPVTLSHCDRISLGRFHLFRYEASGQINPSTAAGKGAGAGAGASAGEGEGEGGAVAASDIPDWEFAQTELLTKNQSLLLRGSREQPFPLSDGQAHAGAHAGGGISSPASMEGYLGSTIASHKGSGTGTGNRVLGGGGGTDENANNLWEKMTRVAEGHERAEPAELREMLRLLVSKAEGHFARDGDADGGGGGGDDSASAGDGGTSGAAGSGGGGGEGSSGSGSRSRSNSISTSSGSSNSGRVLTQSSIPDGTIIQERPARSPLHIPPMLAGGGGVGSQLRASAKSLSQRTASLTAGMPAPASASATRTPVAGSGGARSAGATKGYAASPGRALRPGHTPQKVIDLVTPPSSAQSGLGRSSRMPTPDSLAKRSTLSLGSIGRSPGRDSGAGPGSSLGSSTDEKAASSGGREAWPTSSGKSVVSASAGTPDSALLGGGGAIGRQETFESEALQLQRELEEMQATLKSRVKRYQDLSSRASGTR